MQIRRVVTGQSANGASVFVSDNVLTDGAEVKLSAGDCVIQNGTRHAWHNRGAVPATVATALVGAPRRE